MRAHPRSRGENALAVRVAVGDEGSSPLTRGKHIPLVELTPDRGLIPAHAGKTLAFHAWVSAMRAHPRSRGENLLHDRVNAASGGSSPLTRGKQPGLAWVGLGWGLIPAHAGKTVVRSLGSGSVRAHPRSRGENAVPRVIVVRLDGSSPLTRGKRRSSCCRRGRGGLIPAHAGKTFGGALARCCVRAHPRSRGENHDQDAYPDPLPGSSPLTRGKHFLTCAFIAQIDQILESLELCAFSESYSSQDVYATDAPRDRVRSIGLAPRSSRGAS